MDAPPFPAAAIAAARDAAKAQLRIAGDSEDALIERYAASALAVCEAFTGLAWLRREREVVLSASRKWQPLPLGGVTAIVAVTGLSADGDTIALPPESYAIDIDADCAWVRVTAPGAAGRIMVRCMAGDSADWQALPSSIAFGITLLVAHLFEARDGANPPAAVSALWRPWRRLRLRLSAERVA